MRAADEPRSPAATVDITEKATTKRTAVAAGILRTSA
ncbi:cyclic pyranopterin monophosphate synthase MoaC, partial [Mycobacterium tuberculosis]|nr:cyclic pyranopterin monophosphate synthase MoaC [Mycobacterium tuberculosis]